MTKKPINIIGLTQGQNIDVFIKLLDAIQTKKTMKFQNVGAVVSFADHFLKSKAVLNSRRDIQYIKEWEVFEIAKQRPANNAQLEALTDAFDSGAIWRSVIGDRRLIYGKRSKNFQDYRVHYSDKMLYSVVVTFVDAFTQMIERVKPDVVLGFTAVTFGELLALNICKRKGIPTLQLHSSRLQNYFAFHNELMGTSSHLAKYLNANYKFLDEELDRAAQVLSDIQNSGLIYEGVNLQIRNGRAFEPFKALASLPSILAHEWKKNLNPITRKDHHDPGSFFPWFYNNFRQPIRAQRVDRFLSRSSRLITTSDLNKIGDFAFYPLHSEPEVAIQVLAPPYHKNQIELIRNIAISLPFGMKLVVKEHPRSFGLRPVNFYKKLLEIPNLYFVPMQCNSLTVCRHSKLICVISSTIGLEAACIGKPVIMLGHPKYEAIPNTMSATCENLFDLPEKIKELIQSYKYDKARLIIFIASLIKGSVPIDLYSVMLGKPGRYSSGRDHLTHDEKIRDDFDKLADYAVRRINEECK